jgi:hypothetical protein
MLPVLVNLYDDSLLCILKVHKYKVGREEKTAFAICNLPAWVRKEAVLTDQDM